MAELKVALRGAPSVEPKRLRLLVSLGDDFPEGVTTVTCFATDNAGNSAVCRAMVTVTHDSARWQLALARTVEAP